MNFKTNGYPFRKVAVPVGVNTENMRQLNGSERIRELDNPNLTRSIDKGIIRAGGKG